MWTKPEHLARWWSPKGFTLPVCEVDFRPVGAWRFIFRGPDGKDYGSENIYREIVVPERIVFTGALEQVPDDQVRTTLTFAEQQGKTTLTVHRVHSIESFATKAPRSAGHKRSTTLKKPCRTTEHPVEGHTKESLTKSPVGERLGS